MKLSCDRNGNRVLRVLPGLSIQTNGNLPRTHCDGIGYWTVSEVVGWVSKYGTPKQKEKASLLTACHSALALLENPDADGFEADKVERMLRDALRLCVAH